MRLSALFVVLLTGCAAFSRYKDPDYAAMRFSKALEGIQAEQDLACTSSDGVFWVKAGGFVRLTHGQNGDPDTMELIDVHGVTRFLNSGIANPNCTVKEQK